MLDRVMLMHLQIDYIYVEPRRTNFEGKQISMKEESLPRLDDRLNPDWFER